MGSDPTLFRFLLSTFHSTDWLWELVCERPRRRRILGLDREGLRLIQTIGNGLIVAGSCHRPRERNPSPLLSSLPHGEEDRYFGWMDSTATQGRTLSHQTQPACLRQHIHDDCTTHAASELGPRHLHIAGLEIWGSITLMLTGRCGSSQGRQRTSRTRSDWLGRSLDFTGDERTGAVRWDGVRRNRLQGRDVHRSVAGPPRQTNWI